MNRVDRDRYINCKLDEWTHGMNTWIDGWMDGWRKGAIERIFIISFVSKSYSTDLIILTSHENIFVSILCVFEIWYYKFIFSL